MRVFQEELSAFGPGYLNGTYPYIKLTQSETAFHILKAHKGKYKKTKTGSSG